MYGQWVLAGGKKEMAGSTIISWVIPIPENWWDLRFWRNFWKGRTFRKTTLNAGANLAGMLSLARIERDPPVAVFTMRSPIRAERTGMEGQFAYRVAIDYPGVVVYGETEEKAWEQIADACEDVVGDSDRKGH